MERKKRSKGRGWESCYVKKIYGVFGVEMRAYGQKLVKFCTQTHRRVSFSSIDVIKLRYALVGYCLYSDFHHACLKFIWVVVVYHYCTNNHVCGSVGSEKLFRQGCTMVQYPVWIRGRVHISVKTLRRVAAKL